MSTMSVLFAKQRRLMAVLGVELDPKHPNYRAQLISTAMGAMCEAAEVGSDLNTMSRPWKPSNLDDIRDHVIEESIDNFHYLIELWLLLGLNQEDVETAFRKKSNHNFMRYLATVPFARTKYWAKVLKHVCRNGPSVGLKAADILSMELIHRHDSYDISRTNPVAEALYEVTFGMTVMEIDNLVEVVGAMESEK